MKTFILLLALVISSTALLAQAPSKFSYQAVVRNPSNEVVINTQVGMRMSIVQMPSTTVYSETFTPTTDAHGKLNIVVGGGAVQSGALNTINWGNGVFALKSEIDPTGGTNYTISSTQEFASVPYALSAAQVGNGLPANPSNNQFAVYNGSNWVAQSVSLAPVGGNQPINTIQPILAITYCIAAQGIFPSQNFEPFLGEVVPFGFNFAPLGWYKCDGQLLSIAENDALFALIGTTYGGDGQVTFAIPDLRGRIPLHQGTGSGLSTRTIGEVLGTENVTLTTGNLPAHTHTVVLQ